jgi:hypothetical protein
MPDISDAMNDLMCYICLGGCVVCGLAVPGVVLLALGGLDLSSSKNSVAGTALLGVVALQVSLAVSGTVYCMYGERFGAWSAILCLAVLTFLAPGGIMLGCAGVSSPLSRTAIAGVVLLSIGGMILVCLGAYNYQQYCGRMHDETLDAYHRYLYGTNRRDSLLASPLQRSPVQRRDSVNVFRVDIVDPNNHGSMANDIFYMPRDVNPHPDEHSNRLAMAAGSDAD